MIRLIMLGPPGAGKGTQARVLEQRYNVRQISTGDILRRHRQENTPLGREAQQYMDRGELVPDAVIIGMMADELKDDSGFILDGFPRTVAQAEALQKLLDGLHQPLSAVILFESDRRELVERLTGRWTNPRTGRTYHAAFNPPKVAGLCDDDGGPLVQRPDDQLETVQRRLDVYDAQTAPLIEFYDRTGLLVRVDAMRPVDDVTKAIAQKLEVAK